MADVRPQDYQIFLYAFALGCLDKGDFIDLMEYIDGGGSFPWQELGEYQNLCALLPSFLHLEEVPAAVKDKVARRLYRDRDAKKSATAVTVPPTSSPFARTRTSVGEKAKKTSRIEIINPIPDIADEDDNIEVPEGLWETFSPHRNVEGGRPSQETQAAGRIHQTVPDRGKYSMEQENQVPIKIEEKTTDTPPDMSEFIINQDLSERESAAEDLPAENFHLNLPDETAPQQEPAAQVPSFEPEPIPAPTPVPTPAPLPKRSTSELEAIRKKVVENVAKEEDLPARVVESPGVSPRAFFGFIALLIAVIAAMYLLFNAKINKLETSSRAKIDTVADKLIKTNDIQHEVDRLLASSNRTLVPLKVVSVAEGYGFVVFEDKTGFLQIGSLPQTSPQAGYQLWIEIDGSPVPVSSPFEFGLDKKTVEYFKIADIPDYTSKQTVKFYVTQERTDTKPASPSRTVYLTGSF
jgi:hypothetical protein